MKNIKLPQCSIFTKFVIGLITIWFFSSHTVYSQYQSIFGQHSTEWIFEWHNLDFGGEDTAYVEKDTIVNGYLWKKIAVKLNSSIYPGGLLREDTSIGQVWYKGIYLDNSILDTTEFLLFDFSLQANDTFDVSNMWSGYLGTSTIENTVDSIYYINDLKYIQFKGYYYSEIPIEPYLFVEGIGGNLGVLWKQYFGGLQSQYLLCSYKDGLRSDYINKRFNGDCSPLTSSNEEPLRLPDIWAYPIPCSSKLTLSVEGSTEFDVVSVFNQLGALIYHAAYQSTLDVSQWPAGLYFLAIQGRDFKVTKPIIINH